MRNSRISKFLSLVLRHKPGAIGLTLNANGWADIQKLIDGARKVGVHLTHDLIHEVVICNDKKRFTISHDGLHIRASQGHSIEVDLGLPESVPPEILFHGTTIRFIAGIYRDGIKSGKRIHVHLSPDEVTAAKVGKRHGSPVVLRVQAGQMHRDGFKFFLSEIGVWLTEWVPCKYIDGNPI